MPVNFFMNAPVDIKLKPKSGDCCVLCSYGSVPCPPLQAKRVGEPSSGPCCN